MKNYAGSDYERKFHKKSGYEFGGDIYTTSYIRPFTVEMWDREIEERKFKRINEIIPKIEKGNTLLINEVYEFLLSKKLIEPIKEN